MSYCLLRTALIFWCMLTCDGLKLSPRGAQAKWQKRQASTDTSAPSSTTVSAPNSLLPAGAAACVCRLVQPFNQYNTVTSTYVASGSADGLSTSTVAQPSGTVPGTIVVVTPITYATVTTTSGTQPVYTSTVTSNLPGGSRSTYVVVVQPELSTVTQTTGSLSTTLTVSTTDTAGQPTTVVVVDTPALCGNQGWQWAYARIPLVDHGFSNDFDYSTLQRATYSFTDGTTPWIGINPNTPIEGSNGPYVGPNIDYYGQYTDSEGQASLNHRAYFIPPVTGTYTFGILQADDETAIYLGDAAVRGFNNNNQLVETSYGGGFQSVQRDLNQYSCNPLRVIWIDGGSPGSFNISITGPDGVELDNGPYIRNTCCGTPYTFSSFGNEA